VARDRSANYFSETFKGAQVMVCSEIGSEGRNFQFASNLILFDLPQSPDLLEQRIGRLDRIGQANDVQLHIPVLDGSPGERLFRFFHEALDLFSKPNPAGQSLFDELRQDFEASSDLNSFINQAREINQQRIQELNRGRDRLVEFNSHRPERSSVISEDISAYQGGKSLEDYMELSFDVFGLESDFLGDEVYSIKPTESMIRNTSVSAETLDHYHYPELPEDGLRITYDRDTALSREDVAFFTGENPMVQQALDSVLTDVTGNSTMVAVKHPKLPAGTLLLESIHVIDCVASAELTVDKYLPPGVLRSLMTPNLKDISAQLPFDEYIEHLDVPASALHNILDSQVHGIRKMLAASENLAQSRLTEIISESNKRMQHSLQAEIDRLRYLSSVNPNIREEEIVFLQTSLSQLKTAINNTAARLEAIRIIVAA